jgi:hypothetical protein
VNLGIKFRNEDGCLLCCCAVWSGRILQMFRKCLLPPSSGLSSLPWWWKQQVPLKR